MGGIIQTNVGALGHKLPRGEGEAADVFVGSPLAIIGLWVLALRERFNLNVAEPLPWVWMPNLRPEDTEAETTDNPRKIMIESAFNVEKGVRNYRPAIFISRGSAVTDKIIVDNRAGSYVPKDFKAYYGHITMPMMFDCESENAGESSIIAETAWAFVLATRDIFRADFGLHDITEPILGETIPGTVDKTTWTTQVKFNVVYEQRWGTTPVAPVLREVAAKIEAAGEEQNYLRGLAARDLSHP